MKEFNGHKNWTHWNVSVWICSSVYLYACEMRRNYPIRVAAKKVQEKMQARYSGDRTPDGAKITLAAVEATLRTILD